MHAASCQRFAGATGGSCLKGSQRGALTDSTALREATRRAVTGATSLPNGALFSDNQGENARVGRRPPTEEDRRGPAAALRVGVRGR